MSFAARRAPAYSVPSLALLILASVAAQGCGQNTSSRQEEYAKNNPKSQPEQPVAKFAGHVTVDGATEVGSDTLFIFLADANNLEKKGTKFQARVNPDGRFEFTTHWPGDGVPVGKYVVALVALRAGRKTGVMADAPVPYRGPDGLNNRYNDLQKNKAIPEFLVEVKEPGRTDYEFTLAVAGKEKGELGPYSIKNVGASPGEL